MEETAERAALEAKLMKEAGEMLAQNPCNLQKGMLTNCLTTTTPRLNPQLFKPCHLYISQVKLELVK